MNGAVRVQTTCAFIKYSHHFSHWKSLSLSFGSQQPNCLRAVEKPIHTPTQHFLPSLCYHYLSYSHLYCVSENPTTNRAHLSLHLYPCHWLTLGLPPPLLRGPMAKRRLHPSSPLCSRLQETTGSNGSLSPELPLPMSLPSLHSYPLVEPPYPLIPSSTLWFNTYSARILVWLSFKLVQSCLESGLAAADMKCSSSSVSSMVAVDAITGCSSSCSSNT